MKNKKVRIITIILIVCIFVNIIYCNILAGQIKTLTEENTIAITQLHETQVELNNIRMNLAEANETIRVQSEEIERYKEEAANEDAKWQRRYEEYPEATEAWIAMKSLGWNDTVCAGIMGNLMAEVGGQTLSLKPYLYGENGGYYGICQWSLYYYPSIGGADLKTQCNFLKNTIQKEINTYGYKYASGMNFNKFLQLTSPQDVALCFAKSYERCASASYGVRQRNAQKAYEYFVG